MSLIKRQPKRRKKSKKKQKLTLISTAQLLRKDSVQNDAIPQAPAKMYRDNAANFKIKIKRR